MHVSLRQVLALWSIVLVLPALMHGQDLGSDSANRWLTNQKMRLTPPAYPGVTIAQIEPTRSFNITITQARVLGDSGSTGLHWRGFKYNEDNLRPLFQYNSQDYWDVSPRRSVRTLLTATPVSSNTVPSRRSYCGRQWIRIFLSDADPVTQIPTCRSPSTEGSSSMRGRVCTGSTVVYGRTSRRVRTLKGTGMAMYP